VGSLAGKEVVQAKEGGVQDEEHGLHKYATTGEAAPTERKEYLSERHGG
jgi:hypothetical protein